MLFARVLVAVLIADLGLPLAAAVAQEAPPATAPPAAPAAAAPAAVAAPPEAEVDTATAFSIEQLEQIVSPVALYPDSLLMQIFMASTYPLEVIEAERWIKKNPDLKDGALDAALGEKSWDPSVESLTHFPTVLTRMSENLDWTKDMGDAFLAQQKDVLAAVQRMRQKAYELGNLKSTPEQNVIIEAAPPATGSQTVVVEQAPAQVIRIEPAQPTVVYVPTYSSTVVYGAPPPTMYYPATYAYPPGYVATASLLSFGAGMAVGAALWGDCDWNSGDVDVDIDRNTNINNVNRDNINRGNTNQRPQQWKHNPEHRQGVGYRNDAVAKKYGQPSATNRAANASSRGYELPSSAQPRAATSGAGSPRRGSSDGSARGTGQQARAGQQPSRANAKRPASSSRPATSNRPASSGRDTAFGGADSGRAQRASSQRGASSRGVDSGSFGRAGGGGGGGGGGRGGGGGGGRGGGRRR